MAPAIRAADIDTSLLPPAVARDLRGVAIVGEDDHDVRDDAVAAIGLLHSAGVGVGIDVVAGLGHAFCADFSTRLPQDLNRVTGTGPQHQAL